MSPRSTRARVLGRWLLGLSLAGLIACHREEPSRSPEAASPPATLQPTPEVLRGLRVLVRSDLPTPLKGLVERQLLAAGFVVAEDSSGPQDFVVTITPKSGNISPRVEGSRVSIVLSMGARAVLTAGGKLIAEVAVDTREGRKEVSANQMIAAYEQEQEQVAIELVNRLLTTSALHAFAQQVRQGNTAQSSASAARPGEPATASRLITGAPQPAAYGLVIGIEKYRDIAAPPGVRQDAERVAAVLRTTLGVPEDHLRILLDERATKGDIEKSLLWVKQNAEAGGRVIFYFAGHGAPDPSSGAAYLVPFDGDPSALSSTGLGLGALMTALSQSRAKQVLAILDACFSGAGGRSVLPKGIRPLVRVREEPPAAASVALLTAASGAEISGPAQGGQMGLFTDYLVQAVGQGLADANGDGQVSLQEILDWVKPRVERDARRDNRTQSPSLRQAKNAEAASKFIVAYGLPTK